MFSIVRSVAKNNEENKITNVIPKGIPCLAAWSKY